MIKKLLSLISVVAILATMAVPMASATYLGEQPIDTNGKHIYFADDFDSYVDTSEEATGLICSATTETATILSETVVEESTNVKFTERWNFYNGKFPEYTYNLVTVEKDGAATNKAFNMHKAAAAGTLNPNNNVRFRPTVTIDNDTCERYVVMQVSIKNGSKSTEASAGLGVMRAFGIKSNQIGVGSLACNASAQTVYASITPYDWNDYMFIVDKQEAKTTVVVNGMVTNVTSNTTVCDQPSDIASYGFSQYAEYSNEKNVWFDDYSIYGIDPAINKLACIPVLDGETLTLEFSNPISLTAENISIINVKNAEDVVTISDFAFADGKYSMTVSGIDEFEKYRITATGTDVFGNSTSEIDEMIVEGAGIPRTYYTDVSGDGVQDFEAISDIANVTDLTFTSGYNTTDETKDLFQWSVAETTKNDGSKTKAAKLTVSNSSGALSGNQATGIGKMMPIQNIDASTGEFAVIKAKVRFGEADGSNPISLMMFGAHDFYPKGQTGGTYSNYQPGEWFDVMVTIHMGIDEKGEADSSGTPVPDYTSINGKFLYEAIHKLTGSSTLYANQNRVGLYNVTGAKGSSESVLYVDDVSVYTINKELPAATVHSSADKSINFTTEHALKNIKTVIPAENEEEEDTVTYNFTATVNDENVNVIDASVANGIYSVVLDKDLAVGDVVKVTPVGVVDVTGNTLTGTISATATAPISEKITFIPMATKSVLLVNSTLTNETAKMFVATYDGNKLDKIKVTNVTLKPGVNYLTSELADENARVFLFSSMKTLAPLIEE